MHKRKHRRMGYGNTVASEGLIVLQNATLVNEALLFDGYVAIASNEILERTNDGINGSLNGKLRAVRAANIDVDADSFEFLNNGTVTSHDVLRGGASLGQSRSD